MSHRDVMSGQRVGRLKDAIRRMALPHRHSTLLVALVAAFAVRPLMGESEAAIVLFSVALLLLLLIALYAVEVDDLLDGRGTSPGRGRGHRVVGGVLALAAVSERCLLLIAPSHWLYVVGSLSWLLFFAFVTWSLFRSVLRQRRVTADTISMAVSVYLLLGLTWGCLYTALFVLQPNAFHLEDAVRQGSITPIAQQHAFPILIYFSLTTLATIGFGDITPQSLQARYLAVSEGILGQLYLAILVARLVAMRLGQSRDRSGDGPTGDPETGGPVPDDE